MKAYGLNLYDELTKQVTTKAEEVSASTNSKTAALAAAAFLRVAGRPQSRDEDVPTEEDGVLSTEIAESMLKWHAEAIGRCVELTAASDMCVHKFSLITLGSHLLTVPRRHLVLQRSSPRPSASHISKSPSKRKSSPNPTRRSSSRIVFSASMRLDAAKNELPDLHVLSIVRQVDMICHLWLQYVSIAILPLTGNSVTIRREFIIHNNQSVSKAEGATNTLLQKLTDGKLHPARPRCRISFCAVILAVLNNKLKAQNRNDFKPQNDDISFSRVSTDPCQQCCEILEKVRDASNRNLSGKNLEGFLVEIGTQFHTCVFVG